MQRHRSHVRDWMTTNPVTVRPDATLAQAYEVMSDRGVRRLPVVDDEGSLIGIETMSDVQRGAAARTSGSDDIALLDRRVEEVMAYEPETVVPDDTIQAAAQLMIEAQVSGLPVMEGDQVIGIITESDIFRIVVESWGEETAAIG